MKVTYKEAKCHQVRRENVLCNEDRAQARGQSISRKPTGAMLAECI